MAKRRPPTANRDEACRTYDQASRCTDRQNDKLLISERIDKHPLFPLRCRLE